MLDSKHILRAVRTNLDSRVWAVVAAASVLPSCAFFLISYVARSLPLEPIKARIALALHRGDIQTETKDFVFLDSARGVEPFGDSCILRMTLHRTSSKWEDAFAPRLLPSVDNVRRHPAQELQGAVFGTIQFDPNVRYHQRYWFGNVATTSFLLSVFDVRQARLFLMNASYLLFMLFPVAAARISSRAMFDMAIVSAFGILFSSLPYHGQAFAYAPAFIWSQVTAITLLLLYRHIKKSIVLTSSTMILGAFAAYVEPFSGAFAIGASLVFLSVYVIERERTSAKACLRSAAVAMASTW